LIGRRLHTLLITNIAAPYRRPLFEALGSVLDLSVWFCQSKASGRLWQTGLESEQIHAVQLSSRTVRLLGQGPEWTWNPGLGKRLRSAAFEVYIAGDNVTNAPAVLAVLRAARRRDKPFILWCGAIDTPYAAGNRLSNAYRRWLYSQADAFVAYGQKAKAFLERRGAVLERIFAGTQVIVPGWVWPVAADKAALGLEGRTVVLYVGYLVPRKGVADLIHAYQKARQPDSVLVIIGDGPQRAELEHMAQGDRDIHFAGYLEGEEKLRHYAAADLFVLPTHHDPWSQVINEAMYFGLPVVVTDRDGGAHEVVRSGENGIIVPSGDVDSLAAALTRLISDPALRRRMGVRSKAMIAPYDLDMARNAFLQAIHCAQERRR
jgi:glycosyltransferase involved in cell wall biosynthesis